MMLNLKIPASVFLLVTASSIYPYTLLLKVLTILSGLSCFMYLLQNSFKKKFDNLNLVIIFAPVLYTSLIKKGRGKWPVEALATLAVIRLQEGANSNPALRGDR